MYQHVHVLMYLDADIHCIYFAVCLAISFGSDASICRCRFDIDILNRIVSVTLVSIFSIYGYAPFMFLSVNFIESNAGNK